MKFDGTDYEELIDVWGLRDKYKKLIKKLDKICELGIISEEEFSTLCQQIPVDLIRKHIDDSTTWSDDGECILDEQVPVDMIDFLEALANHPFVSNGDKEMYLAIAYMGAKEGMEFEFIRWFVQNLELMWN